jgi:catechol 2,3-dioxygenase-like lactoylglutathione lyase family enzyme
MSIAQIDHVVIAVSSLDQAIANYQKLGFTVFPGGEHPGGYTHNALVIFADGSYFELIAFKKERPGWLWWERLQRHGEGLIDYALLPGDVDTDFAAIQARGLALEGPTDGGRTRLDGQQLVWKTARGLSEDLPFLCGDVTARELRVPAGDLRQHVNGALGIAGITVVVTDLNASIIRYQALLDRVPVLQTTLAGAGASLAVFQLGTAQITLAMPNATHAGSFAQELHAQLYSRGEGPMAIALWSANPATLGVLDNQLAHRVRLELIEGTVQ